MNRYSRNVFFVLLVVVGFNLLFGIGGAPLFDPDEPVYIETAKEMMRFDDYLSPRIYNEYWYDKPPMFYWLLVASSSIFGVNEFAARLPSVIMALATVLMLYFSATKLFNERVGFWSGMIMGTSIMLIYMGKASVTDATLMFWLTGTLLLFLHEKYWLMYVFCGMAVMAKGPIGIAFPVAIIFLYLLVTGQMGRLFRMHIIPGIFITLLVCAPWYVYMYNTHGMAFVNEFIGFHNISRFTAPLHSNRVHWWFYIPVVILGMFPWTGLLFKSIKDCICESRTDDLVRMIFFQVWWIFVFIFFSIAKTKQVSYMLVLAPALSVIIGWNIDRMWSENNGRYSAWAAGSGIMFFIMAAGFAIGGMQLPELSFGGFVLGGIILILGIGIIVSLMKYCDAGMACWFHVAAGLLTMVVAFSFLLPMVEDKFSVKSLAQEYLEKADDKSRVVYIDKFLRPGFMFYTDIPGEVADTNDEATLKKLRDDPRPKYIVMRRYMYNRMKDKMGAADWEVLEEKGGSCIFRSR